MVRALLLLTWSTLKRYARENRVVRSLVWPAFLGPVTVSLTLVLLALYRAPTLAVAVPPNLSAEIAAQLEAEDWLVLTDDDPEQAVIDGRAPVGTDGTTVWSASLPANTFALENLLRRQRGSAWRLRPVRPLPEHRSVRVVGGHGLRPLAFLFVLYAMVFSMGSIARDKDASILDVERSLPVPEWVPGLARWNATVLVLSGAWTLTVLLMVVMMDSENPQHHLMRGIGSIAAAASIGLAMIGGGGLKQGFSASFASGSFLVSGLVGLGLATWKLQWMPLVSILGNGHGAWSLLIGLATGPVAAWVYAWRVRRSS